MPVSELEYALLALDAYNGNDVSTSNVNFSLGIGWAIPEVFTPPLSINPEFSATVYIKGNEIVIAYRGTNGTMELLGAGVAGGGRKALRQPDPSLEAQAR